MSERGTSLLTEEEAEHISSKTGIPVKTVKDSIQSVSEFMQLSIEEHIEVIFSFRTFGQFKFTPRFQDRITLKRNGRPRNT